MDGNSAAQKHPVADRDITGQQRVIGDDNPVADLNIMRHVRSGHQKIVVPETGRAAVFCAAVYGAVLTNNIIVADAHIAFHGRIKRHILGIMPIIAPMCIWLRSPIVVYPRTTACAMIFVLLPMLTCSSIITYGPISTSSARRAPAAMIAVG